MSSPSPFTALPSLRKLPVLARWYAVAVVVLIAQLGLGLPRVFLDAVCFEQGRRAYLAGDYTATIEHSQNYVGRHPESADAWARLGIALLRQGRQEEGERAVKRAWLLGPSGFYAEELKRKARGST